MNKIWKKKLSLFTVCTGLFVATTSTSGCGQADKGTTGQEIVRQEAEVQNEETLTNIPKEENNENASVDTITFTDDLGREITVQTPKRVAALLGSYAHIWYLAGGTVCASADDAWDDFALPMAEDAVNLGMTKKLSLESLFLADPDFVLASANTKQNVEWMETLEAANITTAYFDVNTVHNGFWSPRTEFHYADSDTFEFTDYCSGEPQETVSRPLNSLSQAKNTWFFTSPLSALVTVDETVIRIDGSETSWMHGVEPDQPYDGVKPAIESREYRFE